MSTDFQIADGFTRLGTEPFFVGSPKANRYLTTTKSQTSPNWGGNGGNEEMNGATNLTSTVTFYDWLSAKNNFSEYTTRQETVNQQIGNNTVTVTVTYYLAKGATIKYYKIYSKPTSNEN